MTVSATDKKKLGKWIKQSREKKQPHLSQRQLALAVDITNASLSSIENGMIFPSEELLLKLIEQLQPPPELREKMLTLFAKAKGTSPPDINAELSKNPKLWGLTRLLIAIDPSEEQVLQIELFDTLKTNSILWFLDFVYRLRNALFHEIIDPLDEEWQIIFKNAYLVLKEVVDINISEIEIMA